VVLVGPDAAGRWLADTLRDDGVPCVLVEPGRERVEALRAAGRAAVVGDASDPATLIQAHVAEAAVLVLTAVDATTVRPIVDTARALNPQIRIVAPALDEQEAGWLAEAGVDAPVQARLALAEALRNTVVAQRAAAPLQARGARQDVDNQRTNPATG
jgi:CPA2 family monovalent cation:H+ antiporter-2